MVCGLVSHQKREDFGKGGRQKGFGVRTWSLEWGPWGSGRIGAGAYAELFLWPRCAVGRGFPNPHGAP